MKASDLPEPDEETGEWPAIVSPASGAWPPSPNTTASFGYGQCIVPFTTMFLRIEGGVSDFRTGAIEVQQQGLSIIGKAVPNSETQIPVMIVTAFLRLWLLAAILMEYGFRKSKWQSIPWRDIRQVGLASNKNRVCIVFDAPNDKGIVKTFSLTFKLAPDQYSSFVGALRPFVGDRIAESALTRWNPPSTIFLLITVSIAAVYYAFGVLAKTHP